MPKIHRLAPDQIQKIAAGEVVERPANIVKELLENALDAGATHITVYIEHGGKQLIRVVDNGCGMSLEDAHMCFEHHATSKVSTVYDLDSITTFGFRGEALSSIAGVSKVTLITKEEGATEAIKLELEQGAVIEESLASANVGTDLAIRDIFFNVPARKKFLKTDDTEWRAIAQLFSAFCLDYLDVNFKLFHNNALHMHCPPTETIEQRMTQVWDHAMANVMLPVNATGNQGGITIHGVISNHQYMRYDRSNIFFFVNKRWVKQQKLSSALLKGYLNVIQPGRFPAACIFIELDTAHVDINIHPRKEEVQFLHPRVIEQLLQQAVKSALEQNVSNQLKKTITFAPATEVQHYSPNIQRIAIEPMYTLPAKYMPSSLSLEKNNVTHHVPVQEMVHTQSTIAQSLQAATIDAALQTSPFIGDEQEEFTSVSEQVVSEKNYTFIGQFSKTYLLLEKEEGLYIVDQHAAHERVLYELFSKRFNDVATIPLLFPYAITIKPDDITLLEPYLDIFERNGIGIEIFSSTQLMVKSTPVHLKNQSLDDLIQAVISWITETQHLDEKQFFKTINERMHAQMACKAAVKAGDVLSKEHIEQLLEDLHKTENRFSCPHGRPTGWLLGTYEIEKKFKRKV
ncbi:MAG: DNA mismatch repair endonuclease MutL [Candidatus Dependentiae bacterium]|nr:DNA mismatch repair endonuclease MutL [Candidatus Dependentiae bacterium]